jgi:hypothetical protein
MSEPFLTPNSYASHHWHGELSLPQAFWVSVVAVSVVLIVADAVLTFAYAHRLMPRAILSPFEYGRIGVYIWQLVGCWRSAATYSEKHGVSWGTVAQVALILGFLQFVGYFMLK